MVWWLRVLFFLVNQLISQHHALISGREGTEAAGWLARPLLETVSALVRYSRERSVSFVNLRALRRIDKIAVSRCV